MERRSAVRKWIGLLVASKLAASCSDPRTAQVGDARWTTYQDVAPLLSQQCAGCHSGATPSGGYSVEGYLSAVSRRDDGTPRAAPGDPNALVLQAAAGTLAGPHSAIGSADLAQLRDWVVRSRVAKAPYTFHFKGWMDPADSEQFHGLALRRNAYRTDDQSNDCQHCHGADLRGGIAQVDCNSCHTAGVFACNTCHGDTASPAPPRDLHGIRSTSSLGVGAHRSHVQPSRLHAAYDCALCHPTASTPDHYAGYGHPDEPAAPVAFRAAAAPVTPSWDRNSATCLNSYCHSPSVPSDPTPTNVTPHWTRVGTGEAACGTCHGVPPASHADPPPGLDFAAKLVRCGACHQTTVVDGRLLPTTHANGTVELGSGPSDCSNCHGDATSEAPPKDTLGRTDERLATVGAHRAHLEARHELRGPIPCTECHVRPEHLHDPGHIDHVPPAVVFPNISTVGRLARTDGAQPSYNPAAASCGSVYCHGNGALLLTDATPRLIRSPVWTAGSSQAACGACHGLPPRNPLNPMDPHAGITRITECVQCHPTTVTAAGAIILTRDSSGQLQSTHIDGIVQVCPPACTGGGSGGP